MPTAPSRAYPLFICRLMNPYEAPQTVALTTSRRWPKVPQAWWEQLLCAAIGAGVGLVEVYFREQVRQAERAALVQQLPSLRCEDIESLRQP